jgi:hypothetical protein
MSQHEQKIKEGARRFLENGEEVLAALVARPRGWTQAAAGAGAGGLAGAVGGALGARKQSQAHAAAEQAEFRLASPMALAVTQRRLLSIQIGSPIGLGIGGEVKELVSAVPLSDVDSIEVKRLLLGKTITVTVRGVPFKLEANALADASGLVEAFSGAKAAA